MSGGIGAIASVFWETTSEALPPLTEEMVEAAEAELGVRLPGSYLALLGVRNGGRPAAPFTAFPTSRRTSWAEDHVPFEEMFGIGPVGSEDGLLGNAYLCEEWEIPDGLVLISGDGHYWIALDYRKAKGGEPAVCWYDTDERKSLGLAATFDAFVAGLRPIEEFDGDTDAPDPDRPPGDGYGSGSISFELEGLDRDLRSFRDGTRSLANTKAWCAKRASGALGLLSAAETEALSAALVLVAQAEDEASLSVAVEAVKRELEALIPAWIKAEGPGWGLDRMYLSTGG